MIFLRDATVDDRIVGEGGGRVGSEIGVPVYTGPFWGFGVEAGDEGDTVALVFVLGVGGDYGDAPDQVDIFLVGYYDVLGEVELWGWLWLLVFYFLP